MQVEADTRGDEREAWYNAMVVFAYTEALKSNFQYSEIAREAYEDLRTVLDYLSDEEWEMLRNEPVIIVANKEDLK
ncbi:MAG: hypothetical protein Q8M92_11090 [Candidatus Subteraquimicrobiales bacterium]|nr:hypothetical protein [Candidatus Subteraquimicrobiales bacterium]